MWGPISSSQKLIPTPGFLPPGCSLFSSVLQCFISPGEILKSGVGITFWIPVYHHNDNDDNANNDNNDNNDNTNDDRCYYIVSIVIIVIVIVVISSALLLLLVLTLSSSLDLYEL